MRALKSITALAAILTATTLTTTASAAVSTCVPNYAGWEGPTMGLYCSQFTSRFDGATDLLYIKLPPNFDPTKAYDVIMWFHAAGQDAMSSEYFHSTVSADFKAITIGLNSRGEYGGLYNQASLQDMNELLNQLASKFYIRHVFAVGASMGGQASLRLAATYPDKIGIVLAAVPAICIGSDNRAPNCTDAGTAVYQAAQAVYNAARTGVYDDKLVYNVPGGADTTTGILHAARALNTIMTGKTWYRYREVAGGDHENYFADDFSSRGAYLDNTTMTPNLRADITAWQTAHAAQRLEPTAGWVPPAGTAQRYIPDVIWNRGGRNWTPGTLPVDGGVGPMPTVDGGTDPLPGDDEGTVSSPSPTPSTPADGDSGGGCDISSNAPSGAMAALLVLAAVLLAFTRGYRRRR